MTPDAIQPLVQLGASDCAIVALAMYLGKPYRVVSEAALKVCRKVHQRGLYTAEIIRTAKRLGCTIRAAKPMIGPHDEPISGLLIVVRPSGTHHIVVLFQGVVIDPADGIVWDFGTWLATAKATVVKRLEVV